MTLINAPTTFFLVHLNLPWLKDEDLPDLVCDKAHIMNVFLGWRTADDSSNLLSSHGSVADVNQHLLCNHLFDRAWNHPCAPLGISSSCQIQECWCKLNSIFSIFSRLGQRAKNLLLADDEGGNDTLQDEVLRYLLDHATSEDNSLQRL